MRPAIKNYVMSPREADSRKTAYARQRRNDQIRGSLANGLLPWDGVTEHSGSLAYAQREYIDRQQQQALVQNSYAIAALVKQDLGTMDFPQASATFSSTPVFFLLNGMREGNALYNHRGNTITMKSIQITGGAYNNPGVAPGAYATDYLRLLVVYDSNPKQVQAPISEILADYDQAGATTTTPQSGPNPNNMTRFRSLIDIRCNIPDTSATISTNGMQSIMNQNGEISNVNRFIKLKGALAKYATNTGLIGDMTVGAIWLIIFSEAPAANSQYNFEFKARLRFNP